eukprot:CAMPEP_0172302532 /NCGR_PEP_ID=MMETSP1058-20130122/4225_1 /TAXON_ID=83371 /ORGANISM="Detonula confervacea, Strain CCMP 353" /LENGTH=408 /DNA_ID=CAMNT_0013013047 /DNA_START=24 /DNA_END=1250 /DNA_ORIENTATION=+
MTMTRTAAMHRTRRAGIIPSTTLLLLLSLQSFIHVSSFPLSSFSSMPASTSNRAIASLSLRTCNLSRNIIYSSSRLYSQKPNYSAEDVVELQYSEFLPASAESSHAPVIFLHGLLGNKRNFASLASSLSTQLQNPRPIYALDLRNHGENTHDWRPSMSYSEMARDVLAFMDKVNEMNKSTTTTGNNIEKAVLVGHSMGGKVAQSLALMHPERVAGLVVLDIAPVRYYSDRDEKGGGGDGSGWTAVEEIVRSVAKIDLGRGDYTTKRDVDAVLRQGMLEDPALRAFVLTNLEQIRTTEENEVPLRWKIHWDGIVNQLDRIAGFDVHDQVMDDSAAEDTESIVPPTNLQYEGDVFFIHGGASRFVRHSYISTIASFFPNHMLTTIRGVGHWVHAEAPDDTIALLKRYLDR